MKSNFSKGMLMTALITGTVLCSSAVAFAEELQEYSLDQMVVTATRTEKRDVEVPATTNVITEQEIKNRGYVSVFDALEQTVGIQSYSYTGGEGDNGSSTGRTRQRHFGFVERCTYQPEQLQFNRRHSYQCRRKN